MGLSLEVPQAIILRNGISPEPESASLFLDLLAFPHTQDYVELQREGKVSIYQDA